MASARQIAAAQSLVSHTLTLTLTASPTGAELVEVFTAAAVGPESFFESQAVLSITDSKSGTWSSANPHAIVGNTGDTTGTGASKVAMNLCESYVRTGGTTLSSGDTVTVVFLATSVAPQATGLIVAFSGVTDHFAFDDYSTSHSAGGATYGNGDSYPASSSSPTTLNWTADLGATGPPLPLEACCGFVGHAKYGAGGGTITPVHGSVIATSSDGANVALAVSFAPTVSLAGRFEPGGTWSVAGSILCSNYRLAQVPVAGLYAWQTF